MAFQKFNQTNNAKSLLKVGVSASATTFILTDGEGDLFPTDNFKIVTEKFNTSTQAIKRQISYVTSRTGDILTIGTRQDENCVQNETLSPKVLSNDPQTFDAGDQVSIYLTGEVFSDVQNEVERLETDKLDKSVYNQAKNVFKASTQGDDDYLIIDSTITAYQPGQPIRFSCDVANISTATLEINALGPKILKKNQGTEILVTGDILENGIVTAIYNATLDVFQFEGQIATPVVTETNINGLTEKTNPKGEDEVMIYSKEDLVNQKSTLTNLLKGLNNYSANFGDGSDGDVVISTNTTLTKDMYYNNLTINSTFILNPNGYKIFVKGTLINNGEINRDGNNGNAGNGMTGGASATILNQGSLNGEKQAGHGGNALQNGNSLPGGPGESSDPSFTNINGVNGGKGGSGHRTGGAGGIGGISTRGDNYNKVYNTIEAISMLRLGMFELSLASNFVKHYSISSSGGGGGGGDNTNSNNYYGGGGGGGGGNGGLIFIFASEFINNGVVSAIGGTGGNGANGTPTNQAAGGGGGGGGNGGIVIILSENITTLGTITLTGGTGGSRGVGVSSNAVNGQDGNDGETIQIIV